MEEQDRMEGEGSPLSEILNTPLATMSAMLAADQPPRPAHSAAIGY